MMIILEDLWISDPLVIQIKMHMPQNWLKVSMKLGIMVEITTYWEALVGLKNQKVRVKTTKQVEVLEYISLIGNWKTKAACLPIGSCQISIPRGIKGLKNQR
jgi:hypothetical protein